ncbi:hypothetical protein PIROE2DRAFT_6019 [Piromyces sp. E2]|nr:hypothetical protein PIROE2DRAFT_6019 [Piromyces sp. E2]|eukprot:OUM66704.1 hypothetical protein PIROE2DRAFT_6019 [Piromyces sp. E2]
MRLNNILVVALVYLAATTLAYTPKYSVDGVKKIIRSCKSNYRNFKINIPNNKNSRVYDCIGYLAHEIYCVEHIPKLYCGILNYCQTENCRSGFFGHEKEKKKYRHSIDSWVRSNYNSDFYRILDNCNAE